MRSPPALIAALIAALITALITVVVAVGCSSEPPSPLAALGARMAEAQHGKAELSPTIPILRVESLKASQAYFRDRLGFTIEWTDEDDFSGISRGDARFFLCERCQGRGASWSFVFVKDVDALYAELKGRGAKIQRPPQDERWKLREMHVVDVDGNVIRFASARPR